MRLANAISNMRGIDQWLTQDQMKNRIGDVEKIYTWQKKLEEELSNKNKTLIIQYIM